MKTSHIIITMIVAIVLAIGLTTLIVANAKCEKICNKEGSLTYNLIPGGGWITIKNDVCVCYSDAKIFKIGEYEK